MSAIVNTSGNFKLKEWLQKTPKSLQKEFYRYYLFLSYMYIFAFMGHLIFLFPIYTMLDNRTPFRSGIACAISDALCFIMIRNGLVNASILLFICTIGAHTILGIVIFGVTSSLPMFFLTLLGLVFFTPWKITNKISFAALLTATAIGLTCYGLYHPPITELTPEQLVFWNSGNILANSLALGYGLYYFTYIVDVSEQKLRYQAEHDLLTGVLNRNAIVKVLVSSIARSQNNHVAAIMGDIDHFKRINDTYGHLAGDDVLKGVTRMLGESLREGDALGRFGGEEFIMVLPGCQMNAAIRVAERIRSMLNDTPIQTCEGYIGVTMSFGVAVMQQGRDNDGEALIKRADQALYRAKNGGRNRVETG